MDRAFTLAATPEEVWPWLVQLGKRRAGWYFPRWFERLVPPGRRGLWHLDEQHLGLAVGDVIPDWGGKDETFTVAALVPPRHLVHTSVRGRTQPVVVPQPRAVSGNRTRVHLRLRLAPVKHERIADVIGGTFDWLTITGLAAGLRERLASST